jgi:hypothetical protein
MNLSSEELLRSLQAQRLSQADAERRAKAWARARREQRRAARAQRRADEAAGRARLALAELA